MELIGFDEMDGYQQFLVTSFKHQLDALKKFQDKDTGLWHTLIDDSTSYIEGSATAGFAYGILKAIDLGMISRDYLHISDKAIQGI
uniref:Glyco_hydro_88 n=1 Tax=uncultured Caulobacter sp. TaxID=158749 RepID=A0A060C5T6_9CAUL|nr:Glyco_hydro_88 [uncultured Caulobacter sp.]